MNMQLLDSCLKREREKKNIAYTNFFHVKLFSCQGPLGIGERWEKVDSGARVSWRGRGRIGGRGTG